MQLSIAELHEIVGGQLRLGAMPPREGKCAGVGRIATDSRRVKAGDVFWGLRGAKHDGSQYGEDALLRGASGLVTSGRWVAPWAGGWTLEVDDSLEALWALAAWQADRFKGRMVTVEGCAGRSTAAAMVEAVLHSRCVGESIGTLRDGGNVEAAEVLINSPSHGDYLIAEISGAGGSGSPARADITRDLSCGRFALPDLAVCTSLSQRPDRRPGDDSAATIARWQSILAAGKPVIADGDDAALRRWFGEAEGVTWVGRCADTNLIASRVECGGGELQFRVDGQPYRVAAWNRNQIKAALSAIAVGRAFGIADHEIADGLASYEDVRRDSFAHRNGDRTFIDEATAEPAAAQSALMQLAETECDGRRVLVIGEIEGAYCCQPVARSLGEMAITHAAADLLIAWGPQAAVIAEGANEAGLPRRHIVLCKNSDEAVRAAAAIGQPGDVVLLIGRGLERVKETFGKPPQKVLRHAA